MEAKNHILVGLFSLGIVYWAITVLLKRIIETPTLLGMAAAAIAFSILPDVDQKNSYASRYANYALIAVLVLSILAKRQAYAILAALGLAFLNIITHRTYVHSLLFGAIVALPLLEFGMFVAAAGFAAFLSHLIVDGEVSFFAEKDWW